MRRVIRSESISFSSTFLKKVVGVKRVKPFAWVAGNRVPLNYTSCGERENDKNHLVLCIFIKGFHFVFSKSIFSTLGA